MFKGSAFDKSLETATSHLKLELDWQTIMIICDTIRQNDITPKYAITAIKKKMTSPNPHTALYALMVLESIVKNCGAPVHEEVANKVNCEFYTQLVQTTTHENVRNKMLELIQTWAFAFRTAHKYRGIQDTMNILKTEGFKFPEMKESDAMFCSDVAPEWADGEVCNRCRVPFSILQRKHHCRHCGQVFCGQCSSKFCMLPKFGIEKEVRVCDGCFDQIQKPTAVTATGAASIKTDEEELPAEYLKSSLAQQNQNPVRKTEEELREEEELQLALALSQSEAESKKQSQPIRRLYPTKSPSPELRRSPSPVEIETPSDPELARYLNRSYWDQRGQVAESPASPSAPSPMPSSISISIQKSSQDQDIEINDFTSTMRTQVEIFVNRMKSNSSRGRNISNDTSVQTLFLNITSMHSKLLTYIKNMDDKRMWYEQLQDKLVQVKDSRAALDVLRQEHLEKLRQLAEEQEKQRQMQMAFKLDIMRKKKQEYLQYQRQLALQKIQEQECEMQMRQEQQKAQYRMGSSGFTPYMSPPPIGNNQGSPMHGPAFNYGYPQMPNNAPNMYGGQQPMGMPQQQQMGMPQQQMFNPQQQQQQIGMPTNQNAFMPINPAHGIQQQIPGGIPNSMPNVTGVQPGMQQGQMMIPAPQPGPPGQQQQMPMMQQHPQHQNYPQQQQQQQQPQSSLTQQPMQQSIPAAVVPPPPQQQQPAPVAEPEKPQEVEVAELITF
ncbi:unnamed protein product [Diamesa serratosioi]